MAKHKKHGKGKESKKEERALRRGTHGVGRRGKRKGMSRKGKRKGHRKAKR